MNADHIPTAEHIPAAANPPLADDPSALDAPRPDQPSPAGPAPGGTLSPGRRSSVHAELQTIDADYYNITDSAGAPLAGLLVLLDRKRRPVRAELHLSEDVDGHRYDLALRQAQLLLGDRYYADAPLPLIVLYARLAQERIPVTLEQPPPASGAPAWLRPVAMTLLALVLFGAGGWFLRGVLEGGGGSGTPATQVEAASVSPAQPQAAQAEAGTETAGRIFETNGLPASRNALPLDIGQRVQLRAGIQGVALRTEPGANAGEVVGYLEPPMQVTIINGPVWLRGNSDTIVWWYVQLDDGRRAWTAANTSDLTLLEPVP